MLKGNCRKKNLTTCERKISSYKPALKCRRRRNNAFLYLTHTLVFEYSNICRPIWTKLRTQSFWKENVLNYCSN